MTTRAGVHRRRAPGFAVLWLLFFCPTDPAAAWSEAAHEVVAVVAWDSMSPEARRAAVELLRAAPADSGIAELAPPGDDRELFVTAAVWADLIKHDGSSYDRPQWHYTNLFWRLDADGEPVAVEHLRAAEENVVERTRHLAAVLADEARPDGERAVALAWLIHLVADLHAPLHTSARVTDHPGEERGDRGGNRVLLHRRGWFTESRWNLHAWWDFVFDEHRPPRFWESHDAWIERLAGEAVGEWPAGRFPERAVRDPAVWAREGLGLAQTVVYPGVRRLRAPSAAYEERAIHASRRGVALAGYRLAGVVEEALVGE